MDRVGFEPTSSRLTGEVTLPYATSNLFGVRRLIAAFAIYRISQTASAGVPFRAPQIQPGGTMSTAAGLTAPHRFASKYLCSHHPGISPGGNVRPACLLSELLPLGK
jgi:hypothetical protein